MSGVKNTQAILGLGSNIGNRLSFIKLTLNNLEKILTIEDISSIYESESLKKNHQKKYYNIVIKVETCYKPEELLKYLKNIEFTIGRIYRGKWEEREIDIDIIDYNGELIKNDILTLPHYDMHNRSFVLYPLLEVYPNYIHPIYKKNINELIENLKYKLDIKKIGAINKCQ
jgi:2-amino-4-hydroxy-6-hydroxymethyldihydropteridine diphosphokinase